PAEPAQVELAAEIDRARRELRDHPAERRLRGAALDRDLHSGTERPPREGGETVRGPTLGLPVRARRQTEQRARRIEPGRAQRAIRLGDVVGPEEIPQPPARQLAADQ